MSSSNEDKLYGVIGAVIGLILVAGLVFSSGWGVYTILIGEASVQIFLLTLILILMTILFGGFLLFLLDASKESKAPLRRKIEIVRSIESLFGYTGDTYIGLDKSPLAALVQLETDLKSALGISEEHEVDTQTQRPMTGK